MASPAIFWYKNLILLSYLTRNYTFQSNIKNTISSGYAVWQTLHIRFFHVIKKYNFLCVFIKNKIYSLQDYYTYKNN